MLGFNAFSEAPFSAEQEQQTTTTIGNEGTLGAGVLGQLGIGETGVVAQQAVGDSVDATQNVSFTTLAITQALATAQAVTNADVSAFGSITVAAAIGAGSGSASIAVDAGKASKTFTATVSNDGSGNKYYIDGTKQASLSLHEEGTYRFDLSDSSLSGHPFALSTTSDGTHSSGSAYTTGVTTSGTAGQAGAYLEIVVTTSTPDLYYYCGNHSGMGGSIAFSEQFDQGPFVMVLSIPTTTVTAGASADVLFAAITIDSALGSAGVNASISVDFTAPDITVPTTTQSGGASFGSNAVAIDITSPAATATAGSAISFSTAIAVEITTAEASVSAGSAQAFVTLIEATTAIAASVSAGSTQATQFTTPTISTFLSSNSAGSSFSADFTAPDIDTPVSSVSAGSVVDVTHSVSISTPVIAIQAGGSVALTFTGPAIDPFVVGIGAGASVSVDADTIGDTIGVTQIGVTVTEFPTIDVPIMEVTAPTLSVSGGASADVTHSVSVTLPTLVVKNDITATVSGPSDIDVTSPLGRASNLNIITTETTSAATTFTVNDNNRPALPSSWFNAPVNTNGTWNGGIKLGSDTGAGYSVVTWGPHWNKDGRIQLKASGTPYYHVRHASDYTTPQNELRSGRVVHISFVPAESTTFRFWNGSSYDSVDIEDFFVGIVHVLNPNALIAGEDTWIHKPESTFLGGWNRGGTVNGQTYFMDRYSVFQQRAFAIDDSGTYRQITSVTNSNGEIVYQPPAIMNLEDDKLDRLTMFYTGAVADDEHNVNYLPSFMPVHNDGSVGPPMVWFSDNWATVKASTAALAGVRHSASNNVASSNPTWFSHPFLVSSPNLSSQGKTGHYIADHALPILYADARYDSTTARQAQATALFWATSDQYDDLVSDSRFKSSYGSSYANDTFNDADPNTDDLWEHDGSLNQEGRVTAESDTYSPSTYGTPKVLEGYVLDDEIFGLGLLRRRTEISSGVYQDVGEQYGVLENPLLSGSSGDVRRLVTDQSSDASNRHTWFAPHVSSGSRIDVGINTDDRYSENLTANAAYLVGQVDQEVQFPLNSLSIASVAPAVLVNASSNAAVTAISVDSTAPVTSTSIAVTTDLTSVNIDSPIAGSDVSVAPDVAFPEQAVSLAVSVQADQRLTLTDFGDISVTPAVAEIALTTTVDLTSIDITPVLISQENVTEVPTPISVTVSPAVAATSVTADINFTTVDITQASTIENPTEFPIPISLSVDPPLSTAKGSATASVTHSVAVGAPIGEASGPAAPETNFQAVSITQPLVATQVISNTSAGDLTITLPTIETTTTVSALVDMTSVSIDLPIFRGGISNSVDVSLTTVTVDVIDPLLSLGRDFATAQVGSIVVAAPEARTLVNGEVFVSLPTVSIEDPAATITQLSQAFGVDFPTVTTDIDGAGIVFRADPDAARIVSVDEENRILFVPSDRRITTIASEIRITFIMGD